MAGLRYRRGRLAMIRFVCRRYRPHPTFVDTTLLRKAGWSGAPAPRLDVLRNMVGGGRRSKEHVTEQPLKPCQNASFLQMNNFDGSDVATKAVKRKPVEGRISTLFQEAKECIFPHIKSENYEKNTQSIL
jgi:hypothetical protein